MKVHDGDSREKIKDREDSKEINRERHRKEKKTEREAKRVNGRNQKEQSNI